MPIGVFSDECRHFVYKGQFYNSDTIVKLSPEYIASHRASGVGIEWDGRPIYKYAIFLNRVPRQDYNATYIFALYDNRECTHCDLRKTYAPKFILAQNELEYAIEQIVYPVEFHETRVSIDTSGMWKAWLIYGAVFAASFVFQQWYLIAGAATYIFFAYRKKMLGK